MKYKNTNKFAFLMGLIFLLALLLSSCSVQQMNNYHCKRCPTKDSIRVEKERHDSIIREMVVDTVPGDTIRDTVKVPCKDFKYHKENKRQKVTIEVKDGELVHESICKEWEFKYWITTQITTLTEKTFIQKTKTIYEKTKRSWFSYWETWACIGAFLLWITIKILKLTGNFPISIKRSG